MKRRIRWTAVAQGQVRRIDRDSAVRILHTIDRYVTTGVGDVKRLQPPLPEYRLRVGDYRIFFLPLSPNGIEITRVLHRSEAYR